MIDIYRDQGYSRIFSCYVNMSYTIFHESYLHKYYKKDKLPNLSLKIRYENPKKVKYLYFAKIIVRRNFQL